jgi:hypothetical protein
VFRLALDADGDGVQDAIDNCPLVANADQADTDLDGIGDACEAPSDTTPPSVTVLVPNGGEILHAGSPFTITWTASDDVAVTDIDLDYSLNKGVSWTPIPACQNRSGTATSCVWNTADLTTTAATAKVRVRAHDAVNLEGSDASNANFQLKSGTAFVTMSVPDAANLVWQAGKSKPVKVAHNIGKGQAILIEVNRNYPGGEWSPVTGSGCTSTSAATTSTCNWVPSGVTAGATARMRVTALGVSGVSDVSNASFKISSRVKLTVPNTNVTWPSGTTRSIKWTHNLGASATFDISVDTDGDLDCNDLILSTNVAAISATAGSLAWVVSGTGTQNRICVKRHTPDPDSSDSSDVAFRITP